MEGLYDHTHQLEARARFTLGCSTLKEERQKLKQQLLELSSLKPMTAKGYFTISKETLTSMLSVRWELKNIHLISLIHSPLSVSRTLSFWFNFKFQANSSQIRVGPRLLFRCFFVFLNKVIPLTKLSQKPQEFLSLHFEQKPETKTQTHSTSTFSPFSVRHNKESTKSKWHLFLPFHL